MVIYDGLFMNPLVDIGPRTKRAETGTIIPNPLTKGLRLMPTCNGKVIYPIHQAYTIKIKAPSNLAGQLIL